jgi:hypothetical protein
MASIIEAPLRSRCVERKGGQVSGGRRIAPPATSASSCNIRCVHNHFAARSAAGRESACVTAASTHAAMPACRARTGLPAHRHGTPELASIKMRTRSVLARLRIRRDDFGTYQGYLRYADIVAGHAPNAQDARIFAT